jgi:hypothetical protein
MEVSSQLQVPAALTPAGWVCPRVGLDAVEKKNYTGRNRTLTVQPVARRFTDWATPTRQTLCYVLLRGCCSCLQAFLHNPDAIRTQAFIPAFTSLHFSYVNIFSPHTEVATLRQFHENPAQLGGSAVRPGRP